MTVRVMVPSVMVTVADLTVVLGLSSLAVTVISRESFPEEGVTPSQNWSEEAVQEVLAEVTCRVPVAPF